MHSVRQAITDEEDRHDIFLWVFIVGVGGLLLLTGTHIYKGNVPSLSDFAQSFAWLLGGGGGGYSVKRLGEKYGNPSSPSVDVDKE
jgi:hypothetical protein